MSSTVETTGRPGLRRVIDKIIKILGKEWLYIGESLFIYFFEKTPPFFQGRLFKFLFLFRNRYLSSVHQSHTGNCFSVMLSSKERT